MAKQSLKKKKTKSKTCSQIIQKIQLQKQKKQRRKKDAGKKNKFVIKTKEPAQPNSGFLPKKEDDISYNLKSAPQRRYETGYYSCKTERTEQQDFYNPVLNSRGVDDLIRAAKIKNEYLMETYVNPFLQEKFDSWKMLHRIDVQVRYVLEPYSSQRV